MSYQDDNNPERVAAGYKAALRNPNVSESAKEHASEELKDVDTSTHTGPATNLAEVHHQNRVMGGYKSAMHNERVGHEAKEHARDVLGEEGYVEPEARLPGHEPTYTTGRAH
ncbi:hypothetical protein PUNSTDRAFT_63363 [Punctularia strigosozonata HHB-11173 SS5]|uniref:uncharacterized protein n=1 Tax=Punctularia strigosozonata (strain HHB-11173) TaxID=741275 RepID=UPI0004416D27|nr:uncharacterized protein PUNSTDRAFT_63363 [Punctularia strigosozonata HHB-11173 SS5]EIN11452.1 hypothetical protein PUNSTDRAFT_63363 [Punctularia strigosozonata HHB-11173 SS5]